MWAPHLPAMMTGQRSQEGEAQMKEVEEVGVAWGVGWRGGGVGVRWVGGGE